MKQPILVQRGMYDPAQLQLVGWSPRGAPLILFRYNYELELYCGCGRVAPLLTKTQAAAWRVAQRAEENAEKPSCESCGAEVRLVATANGIQAVALNPAQLRAEHEREHGARLRREFGAARAAEFHVAAASQYSSRLARGANRP